MVIDLDCNPEETMALLSLISEMLNRQNVNIVTAIEKKAVDELRKSLVEVVLKQIEDANNSD